MITPAQPATSRARRNRLWIAGGGAVAVAVVALGFWMWDSGPGNAVARNDAKPDVEADGAFHPTEGQWSSFKLPPVR